MLKGGKAISDCGFGIAERGMRNAERGLGDRRKAVEVGPIDITRGREKREREE